MAIIATTINCSSWQWMKQQGPKEIGSQPHIQFPSKKIHPLKPQTHMKLRKKSVVTGIEPTTYGL